MVQPYHPAARDAGVAKVSIITATVVVAATAGTIGLGAAIAVAAPPPKSKNVDFTDDGKPPVVNKLDPEGRQGPQLQPPAENPESSSGDEDTTSGGS